MVGADNVVSVEDLTSAESLSGAEIVANDANRVSDMQNVGSSNEMHAENGPCNEGGHASSYHRIGIDCGSKTVKILALDSDGHVAFKSYQRHNTNIRATLVDALAECRSKIGDVPARFTMTGSAGMQIAEELDIPFVQEVVATKKAVRTLIPDADVVIELGGEDSKILFLTGGEELRMNSTCAGGTGGFIDTIAGMLNTNAPGLGILANRQPPYIR